MDHFKQLATFVSVAQHGSLSAAARVEQVATAMVSRRIEALEARLGVKLLQRTTRRLSLTAEGQAFLEDCQRILRELEEAESAVALRSLEASGQLRLSAPAGFGRQFVAPLAANFARAHPRVTLALDLTDRLVDLLAEGVDCAIRFGEQADSNLVRTSLGVSRRVVVAAPAYIAKHGMPKHPRDLEQHQCLTLAESMFQPNAQRGWTFQLRHGEPQLFRLGSSLSCSDGAVLRLWALEGLGLAWRSWWEVGADLIEGRLVAVLEEFAAPPTGVYLLTPARKHLPLRVRLFVEYCRERFSQPHLMQTLSGSLSSATTQRSRKT